MSERGGFTSFDALWKEYRRVQNELTLTQNRAEPLKKNLQELDRLERLSHSIRDQEHPRIGLGDGERASLRHAQLIRESLELLK